MLLADKVGVITGATNGIGRACVDLFLAEGATVIALDLVGPEAPMEGVAAFYRVDVSDPASVERAFADIRGRFDRLDFAVNNAGVTLEGEPTPEWTDTHYGRTIAINLDGVYRCMREEVAMMRPARRGSIVNLGSVAAMVGVPHLPAYAATKHGVVGMSKSAALQFGPDNIRTNVVCPGSTRTAMMEGVMVAKPELREHVVSVCPLRRMAEPREIAEAILWLASDRSSYVNGAVIPVDGGFTAG